MRALEQRGRSFAAALVQAALAVTIFMFHDASFAGSFDVNPIRIELAAENRSAALTVRNTGPDPVVVQVTINAWSQDAGKDVLTATRDIITSPPVVTIPPAAEQVIRVGLRRAPDIKQELSYRIFLQEVPPPPRPGFQGLVVALKIGLPIFVQPRQGPAKAQLIWNAALSGTDSLKMKVENQGTGHIQVSTVQLFNDAQKDALAEFSGLAYILPGQKRDLDLKLRNTNVKKGDRLRMRVSTDAGSIDTAIDLD